MLLTGSLTEEPPILNNSSTNKRICVSARVLPESTNEVVPNVAVVLGVPLCCTKLFNFVLALPVAAFEEPEAAPKLFVDD